MSDCGREEADLDLFNLLDHLAIELLRFTELLLVFILDGGNLFLFCPKMMLVDLPAYGENAIAQVMRLRTNNLSR